MRRGLIAWSREEVPAAALERRVARLQRAMAAEGLDVVLVYTSTAQPAAVSWLTHFVPYSNDGLLVVFAEGPPAFFASFSKRVAGWIREVSHVGEIRLGGNLGRGAAKLLEERFGARRPRIGAVSRDRLPESVLQPFGEVEDASALFAALRQPPDDEEKRLAVRASSIAKQALDAAPGSARLTSEVLAAVERSARLQGAEEVFLRVAPDLRESAVLRRIEGDADWGPRAALQLSLAYKGVWVRSVRCVASGPAPDDWSAAEAWLAKGDPSGAPGRLIRWTVEACVGSLPLSVVASLPRGSLAVVSAELDLPGVGAWHGAALVVL